MSRYIVFIIIRDYGIFWCHAIWKLRNWTVNCLEKVNPVLPSVTLFTSSTVLLCSLRYLTDTSSEFYWVKESTYDMMFVTLFLLRKFCTSASWLREPHIHACSEFLMRSLLSMAACCPAQVVQTTPRQFAECLPQDLNL